MTLNQLRALPQDLTLAQCHLSRGDELYAGRSCQVAKRYTGSGFLLAWLSDIGVPMSVVLTNEAHAVRAALFVAEHHVLPPSARRSRKKTEPGLMPVGR